MKRMVARTVARCKQLGGQQTVGLMSHEVLNDAGPIACAAIRQPALTSYEVAIKLGTT